MWATICCKVGPTWNLDWWLVGPFTYVVLPVHFHCFQLYFWWQPWPHFYLISFTFVWQNLHSIELNWMQSKKKFNNIKNVYICGIRLKIKSNYSMRNSSLNIKSLFELDLFFFLIIELDLLICKESNLSTYFYIDKILCIMHAKFKFN